MLITPISAFSAVSDDEPVYTTLRSIDLGTFNEYRYRLTEQFFILREWFTIDNSLDVDTILRIAALADEGYKYLPDNLVNKNYLSALKTDLQKGAKYPGNETAYAEILGWLADYIEKVEIDSISGSIEGSPISGNAPLVTTLRAKVQDPTGTKVLNGNYTWWIDVAGEKQVIGRGPSINYSFREEWKYSVFLDVTSSHKNAGWFTDVLPYRERVDINVNEKVASLIVKVNSDTVSDNTILKFTPDDAAYGLLFDATSSTPTSGTRFSSVSWDFGNGVTRSYSWNPKIERIIYGREGDYEVRLTMVTNEWKTVESSFLVSVHDPIATIEVNREDGYIGDKFTFAAKTSGVYRDLTYSWEIVNIEADRVIHQVSGKVLTYAFTDKWKYNVRLKVRRASGEIDQDTRIVYVTSQTPIAEFETKIPQKNKPNRVFFDASRSFDPDISDDGNLKYDWFINGSRVKLQDSNANGSIGYFTFDSIGTQSVNLEVTDLDGITAIKKWTVQIDSILSVDMFAFPRVIQRNWFIKFVAESPEAELYEWDFGDGKKTGGTLDKVTHTYEKSGSFDVTLTVSDTDNNSNTYKRTVYVSESDMPLALINPSAGGLEIPQYDAWACQWVGAYMVDRVTAIKLDGSESINVDGETTGLEYSWKIGNGKFATSASVNHKFDEIGCFPVKLTVKSDKNGSTASQEIMMSVQNVLPTLSSLKVQVEDPNADPLIVRVQAAGALDPDGVIQSYLWYYYTDTDSEPQDFRATATSSTAFVIPKITGNYYFVAILKDNNEARITSEEITGSKYFTTITGDNINTPIVDLQVNDNSTVIGEEITFTASAKNILGQTIDKDASFSWDFDGDWFYDTQTSTPTTTYKFRKSGEFYSKVKVKYRGISSTKNVTVNVWNKLVADFDYISIGNKIIFFDTSSGQVDSRTWDLWDGTKKTGTNFTHTYTDGKVSHEVSLSIAEGTKVKEVTKTVSKNIKNILKTRWDKLVVFTSPLVEDEKIVLENSSERVFVYTGESTQDAVEYAIDYDTENDSDFNGWVDDDADNKGTASFVSWDIAEIPLNEFSTQNIRVFLRDAQGNVIATQDITIEKTYIEETNIDPDTIVFEWVSESEKEKIEALKDILVKLPQQQKLQSLSYVQKLQENWNDPTEKTRTILDFENYIFWLRLENEDELIQILESLLVEGQEDQSQKQITYQALVNLVPQEIMCEVESGTCYDTIISKLEDIKASDDVEYNKALGKEILQVIGTTSEDLMTNTQKLDFKAILTSLVYGWEVSEIPDEEKQEVVWEGVSESEWETTSWAMGLLITVLKWLFILILVVIGIIAIFYLIYLVFNKDKSVGFSEYILSITWSKSDTSQAISSDVEDILWDFDDTSTKPTSDILSDASKNVDPLAAADTKSQTKTQLTQDEVPDWLKWNFAETPKESNDANTKTHSQKNWSSQAKANKVQEQAWSKDTTRKTEGAVPDWLKGDTPTIKDAKESKDSSSKDENNQQEQKTSTPGSNAKPIKKEEFDIEKETAITPEDNVPDWLKWSFDAPKKSESENQEAQKKQDSKNEATSKNTDAPKPKQQTQALADSNTAKSSWTPTTPKQEAKDNTTWATISDDNVPDWLKWSFDTPKKSETEKPETDKSQQAKSQISKPAPKKPVDENKKTKNTSTIKSKTVEKKSSAENKTSTPSKKTETPKENVLDKKDELWDDGMKIPDWLKADDEK